jgi:hypothetical protein
MLLCPDKLNCLCILVYDWRGDNAGPPLSAEEVQKTWEIVQGWFPGADVIPSDLVRCCHALFLFLPGLEECSWFFTRTTSDEFVDTCQEAFTSAALATPAAIAALPVVTKEIGDTWIMGIPRYVHKQSTEHLGALSILTERLLVMPPVIRSRCNACARLSGHGRCGAY